MSVETLLNRRKEEMTQKAIRDGGFYGKNGVWNSIITFSGDKRIYRERVETIIVKDGKEVFVKKKPNGEYFLPGGSTERDLPHIDQALNECREEAHINVSNIESTGITYKQVHEVPSWCKRECEVEWQGTYTEIYVGDYDGKFNGHIDREDQDPFIESGKWYSTKECFKWFRKEHREALLWYIKTRENNEKPITESYTSNYFKNRKLLKTISRNPEVERSTVEQIIAVLKKEYSKLSTSSKIQRERKQSDVAEIFHPILTLDFQDGCSICIALCFDDSEFSEGCAFHSKDAGDVIAIYPCFFKTNKENQIFTILHEVGHIRLNHIDLRNSKCDIFGNDITRDYRISKMKKGKVMYPEANADLYAVLNGASMYAILNSSVNKDYDDKCDYRFTNSELASRYHQVFNSYGKLRGFAVESTVSLFDIACVAIYEMVYQNDGLDYLTEDMKDDLYSIVYEYAINKKIKNDKRVKQLSSLYQEAVSTYNEKLKLYENNIAKSLEIPEDRITLETIFNENTELPRDININFIRDDLIYYKENVNESYMNLYNGKTAAYENATNKLVLEKIRGVNSKAVFISEYKNYFEKTILSKLEDMCELIEEKGTDTPNKERILYVIEALTKAERDKIPTKKFGIEEIRAYPLDTKKHVLSAIKLFSRAKQVYKQELATKILHYMKKYKIPEDVIGKNNELRKYI